LGNNQSFWDEFKFWIALNMVGSIISINQNTHFTVDIEFNDVTLHRPIHFKDHFGFSMAVLTEKGALFASPQSVVEGNKEESRQSALHYRAFSSWATPSDWTVYMPLGEDILHVAMGDKWALCITSENHIRVFTLSGIQSYIFSHAGGPVVCATGGEEFLMIVKHATPHPG
jgi:chromosome transmission fidelity protein 4